MRCLEEPRQGGEIVELREEIFRLRDQGAQVVCVHASESVVAVREKVCRCAKEFSLDRAPAPREIFDEVRGMM